MAKSSIMRTFLNNSDRTTTKRNRGECSASPQLTNKAKRAPEVVRPPARQPSPQQQGDQQQQEYQKWQIELYEKMRAMGRDAIPP
jgi:hypothetical protein